MRKYFVYGTFNSLLYVVNLRLKIFFMENLESIPTKELEKELAKRADKKTVYCSSCNKWTVYLGCSRSWREELHCYGCRKPVENCICSRI